MTLINAGGHFDGGTVPHWPGGTTLRGGDIVQVAQDRRWVSVMYSFPNYIPLPAASVERIVAALEPFAFDRIYGAWWDPNVASDGKEAVRRSAERYKRAILRTEVEGRPPARPRRCQGARPPARGGDGPGTPLKSPRPPTPTCARRCP